MIKIGWEDRGPELGLERRARQYHTRNLTTPHDPTLNSVSHQCGCVGT
jgi:hypothetical protein